MMRLNLLPWRERQRQAALRRFRGQLVAGALLALCAVMLVIIVTITATTTTVAGYFMAFLIFCFNNSLFSL